MSLFARRSNWKIDYSGLVGKKGIDDISMKRCVGNRIVENGTNGQKAGMIKFSAESIEEITSIIKDIKKNLTIEDLEGNNMLLTMFDEKRLLQEEGING